MLQLLSTTEVMYLLVIILTEVCCLSTYASTALTSIYRDDLWRLWYIKAAICQHTHILLIKSVINWSYHRDRLINGSFILTNRNVIMAFLFWHLKVHLWVSPQIVIIKCIGVDWLSWDLGLNMPELLLLRLLIDKVEELNLAILIKESTYVISLDWVAFMRRLVILNVLFSTWESRGRTFKNVREFIRYHCWRWSLLATNIW